MPRRALCVRRQGTVLLLHQRADRAEAQPGSARNIAQSCRTPRAPAARHRLPRGLAAPFRGG